MTISFGFFNSMDGDRRYTAANIGDYLQGLITSGVYADDNTSLRVEASGGMTVTVQPGRAMLNFKYMNLDSPLQLTLAAGGAQDRVDAIVAYMDLTERACGITVKQGTQAASPKAPAMERSSTRHEYMLAAVRVKKLSNTIAAVNVTDKRGDTSVCGYVTNIVGQIPTGTLLLQYQAACAAELAAMQEYVAQQKAEFDAFFANMTGELQLSGFLQEYINPVTLKAEAKYVTVGITDYVPQEDVLYVSVNGVQLSQTAYTVGGTGKTATVTFGTALKAGDAVEFRVLKFRLGTVTMNGEEKLLAVDNDGTILTDGTYALKLTQ
jgi:hypothetical protein